MLRTTRALIALLILPVVAGLLQFGPFGLPSQLAAHDTGKIHKDVLAVLETEAEVGVIISLEGPGVPLEDATLAELKDNTAARQESVLGSLDQDDFTLGHQYTVVAALVGALTASGAEELAGHPDVAAVHVNEEIFPVLDESVPFIHADELHALGVTGDGIDVAVFDTGIATGHPDLASSLVHEHCVVFDQSGPRPDLCPGLPDHPAEDGHYHGTHVSGIVASDGDNGIAPAGVAPGVRVHAFKALTDSGFLNGTWAGVLEGINHIIDVHRFEIEFVNFSIRGAGNHLAGDCDPPPSSPAEYPNAPALRNALKSLRLDGTLAFAASGNSGFKDRMTFPACVQDVIAVGSVNTSDVVAQSSQASDDLDLLAPGVGITSTTPSGAAGASGTSMASPHALGVAALLLETRPDLNPTAPGLSQSERLARAEAIEHRLKATGTLVKDDHDPNNVRWIKRVDARVALLVDDDADFDGDGVSDGRELGDDPLCGLRNPLNPWDYYDVSIPRDGSIDLLNDITAVVANYAPGGYQPGSPALAGPGTMENYDRGPPIPGGAGGWVRSGPDHLIDLLNDIVGVIAQYNPGGC